MPVGAMRSTNNRAFVCFAEAQYPRRQIDHVGRKKVAALIKNPGQKEKQGRTRSSALVRGRELIAKIQSFRASNASSDEKRLASKADARTLPVAINDIVLSDSLIYQMFYIISFKTPDLAATEPTALSANHSAAAFPVRKVGQYRCFLIKAAANIPRFLNSTSVFKTLIKTFKMQAKRKTCTDTTIN